MDQSAVSPTKNSKSRRRKTVLLFSSGLFLAYLVGCWFLAGRFLSPDRKDPQTPPELRDEFVTHNGMAVPVWVTPDIAQSKVPDTVFVFSHGYKGSRGLWTESAKSLAKSGYGSVILSMSGQDRNPEKSVGFGPKEADLILDTVAWVRGRAEQRHPRIILVGASLGAAASWLAVQQDPSIDGIVSESSFSRFGPIPAHWLDLRLPFGGILLRPVIWFAEMQSGIHPESINPVESAKAWRKPALIIHAEGDKVMALQNAVELSEASHAPLWRVAGAEHSRCQAAARAEYVQRLKSMAEQCAHLR